MAPARYLDLQDPSAYPAFELLDRVVGVLAPESFAAHRDRKLS